MSNSNEKLVRIIEGYDPSKKDVFCKIDIIKLSQMPELQNPVAAQKEVVEAFLEYATTAVKNHPAAHLNENVERMFGQSLEKMKEIAPEAYDKYEAAQKLDYSQMMRLQNKDYAVGA